MIRKRTLLVAICAWFGVQSPCNAEQPVPASTSATDTEEILVQAKRLSQLHAEVVAAEDRFFARYNELNKVNDFDVQCRLEAPTGSRRRQRTCETQLQADEESKYGMAYVQMLQARSNGAPASLPGIDPEAAYMARYQEYQNNLLYLIKMNPDLLKLALERIAAQKRYDTEVKRRFGK